MDNKKLTLEFIGTGGAFNHTCGNCSAILRGLPRSGSLLLDCGHDVPARLGVRVKDISHIWISHVHSDRVGGLEELAWLCKDVFHTRPILWAEHNVMMELRQNLQPLLGKFKGPKTSGDFLNMFFNPVAFRYLRFFDGGDYREQDGIVVEQFASSHIQDKPSMSLTVSEYDCKTDTEIPKFVYTGDCSIVKEESSLETLKRFPTVFHDFSIGNYEEDGEHTSMRGMQDLYSEDVRKKITGMGYETLSSVADKYAQEIGLRGVARPGDKFIF